MQNDVICRLQGAAAIYKTIVLYIVVCKIQIGGIYYWFIAIYKRVKWRYFQQYSLRGTLISDIVDIRYRL